MKILIGIIPLLFLFFVQCNEETQDYKNKLLVNVTEAEILVNAYDSAVMEAMYNLKYDSIFSLAANCNKQVEAKLDSIQSLKVPEIEKLYKAAAVSYLKSLLHFIDIQEKYAFFNDSITAEEVNRMDIKNAEAVLQLEKNHQRLVYYQNKFPE